MKKQIVLGAVALIAIVIGGTALLFFKSDNPKTFAQNLLAKAKVTINGDKPWDVIVHNEQVYNRVMSQGTLGLGQAYMDGWWDSPALDQFFFKVLRAHLYNEVKYDWRAWLQYIKARCINLQSKTGSLAVAQQHYDLGNDLFEIMLDKLMVYSCGYWDNAQTLDEAQEKKLDLICKKLYLKPGMKLLDIGCGWGGLAYWAAKNYGVEVTGVTISKEQAALARERCKGLPVTILLQDYRDVTGMFDRIVSVGMFEHVGYKNYEQFMRLAHDHLSDDGLFLLHTIGSNQSVTYGDPWISTYIFPNSMLPSISQIGTALEGLFIMEDWHNFSADYDKTLMAWFERFEKGWPAVAEKYGQRFYRMWQYYLLSCAALFRARQAQLWQIVLSKNGVLGGYSSIR